jgi:DNA modification methylase
MIYYQSENASLLCGDCLAMLKCLPEKSVQCCVTSPPYFGLRSYLPGVVRLKIDAPQWVSDKIKELSILPVDHIKD